MATYVTEQVVEAEPMTLGRFAENRGGKVAEGENPDEPGYMVTKNDGCKVRWYPKAEFETKYRLAPAEQ